MNKLDFCKNILQTVDNSRLLDGASDDEVVETISILLSTLTPKDTGKFSSWGMPNQQTTPEKCWD